MKATVKQNAAPVNASGFAAAVHRQSGRERPERGANLETAQGRPKDHAFGAERVAIHRIEFERARGSCFGAENPFGIGIEVRSDLAADHGQNSPRVGEARIEFEGTIEHLDGGQKLDVAVAKGAIDGAHVKFEGERVSRDGTGEIARLFASAWDEAVKD